MFRWLNQQKRISDLEETVKKLQDDYAGLDSEWTDWYEKFRLLHMRLAKRQEREEQRVSREGGSQEGGSVSGGTVSAVLSPKQRLIQEQIAAHRRANGGN